MIKIVFFDIDGTLIPKGTKDIPANTLQALEKLQATGVKVFIATGRSLNALMTLGVNQFNFDGYLTLNGALCYDAHLEKMFGLPFTDGETEVLAKIFETKKIAFEIVGEFARYANYDSQLQKDIYSSLKINLPSIQKYKGEKIYQICACLDSKQKELLSNFLDESLVSEWAENAIDIFPSNGGKQNAIKRIMEIYDLSVEETMAFGDAENDMKMLEVVGTGVAMGNASDELKKIAKYVTTDVDDDGIGNALRHYELID